MAYHPVNGHCLFFNSSKNLLGDDGDGKIYNVAIADADQLTASSKSGCPFAEGATYTTPSGLEFDIICNRDYYSEGGDFCPDPIEDNKCHLHADTMEECLDLCSQSHPLCQGVTYNANLVRRSQIIDPRRRETLLSVRGVAKRLRQLLLQVKPLRSEGSTEVRPRNLRTS